MTQSVRDPSKIVSSADQRDLRVKLVEDFGHAGLVRLDGEASLEDLDRLRGLAMADVRVAEIDIALGQQGIVRDRSRQECHGLHVLLRDEVRLPDPLVEKRVVRFVGQDSKLDEPEGSRGYAPVAPESGEGRAAEGNSCEKAKSIAVKA